MENGAGCLGRWIFLRVSGISLSFMDIYLSSQLVPFSMDILRNILGNIPRLVRTLRDIPETLRNILFPSQLAPFSMDIPRNIPRNIPMLVRALSSSRKKGQGMMCQEKPVVLA